MENEAILREYQRAKRARRDQMWFFYRDHRPEFDEIESMSYYRGRDVRVDDV